MKAAFKFDMSSESAYFDLKKALAQYRSKGLPLAPSQGFMIAFSTTATDDAEEADRLFTHPSPDKILDFLNLTEKDFKNLLQMVEDSHLYRINLTFMMDHLLHLRQEHPMLEARLKSAFEPYILPPVMQDNAKPAYKFAGGLTYPFLDHCRSQDLIHAYLSLVEDIASYPQVIRDSLNFGSVIDANPSMFLTCFNGYKVGEEGALNGRLVLENCLRCSHDIDKKLETYVEKGRIAALSLAFSSPHDLIEAWLHADRFQHNRCEMIDTAMQLIHPRKLARWIKIDVFTILEREAMKQVFAENLVTQHGLGIIPAKAEHLRSAIQHNADGDVDKNLQQLLTQTLTPDQGYSGIAEMFYLDARKREIEFQSLLNNNPS